ncbi:MAG: alanine racemase [Alistipes sp.]|nr:alanine racemase [Alistipes sp.]
MKYTLSQIAQICSGVHYGAECVVGSVITDSRSVVTDTSGIFVAMKGVNHDSHNYIDDMAVKGVKAFLVEREVEVADGCGVVVVENAMQALQRLAKWHREHFTGEVVAITGSNGKTTVKEWIAAVMPKSVKLFRSPRSYNSQLGVALSLLMIPDDADMAIIEAGISQPDEMERLYSMIQPKTVLFTAFGDAHQANFESYEQKIREKLILAKSADTIIYNSVYNKFAQAVEEYYSTRRLIDAAKIEITQIEDTLSVNNARLVAAFCYLYGYPIPTFDSLPPLSMRLEVKQGADDSLIVDDSYSCDIDSLSIALDYLDSVAANRRKVVIMSDILQSGWDDKTLYSLVAKKLEHSKIDLFVGIGDAIACNSSLFTVPSIFFKTTESLLSNLSQIDTASAAILIKGNRASRTERISHHLELRSHTTVMEVNLRAMERNINYFRAKMSPETKLVAMVKASSYGVGETEVAQMLCKQGVDYLAVAFADEGVDLRLGGITMPIIVLNADDKSFDTMVKYHLEPEIYSLRSLEAFARVVKDEKDYPVHIKLDTGMHRLGFVSEDIPQLLTLLDKYSTTIRVATVFTHLCASDEPSQDDFTRKQIALFEQLSSCIISHVGYSVLRHVAASAAILRFTEAHFDMCRLGLGMYGYGYEHNDNLEPVSTLRTRIVQIHTLDAGETVGYGRSGVITRPSRIATIPIGYADGLDRAVGCGRWNMIVRGSKAPTVGRICMDSCMIDVTDIPDAREGDVVTIFSPEAGNTAEDMAQKLNTIPYEVLTSVSKRVKRIYIYE